MSERRPLTCYERQALEEQMAEGGEGMIGDFSVGPFYIAAYPMRCPHEDAGTQYGEVWLSAFDADPAVSHSVSRTRELAEEIEKEAPELTDFAGRLRRAADHAEFGPVKADA